MILSNGIVMCPVVFVKAISGPRPFCKGYAHVERVFFFCCQNTSMKTPAYLWHAETRGLGMEKLLKHTYMTESLVNSRPPKLHNLVFPPCRLNYQTLKISYLIGRNKLN